jgi:trimeric autotransporter adhesin
MLMTNRLRSIFVLVFWLAAVEFAHAQGNAFTYQGRLTDNGSAYTGNAEFQATLWDAVSGGIQIAANSPAQVFLGVTNGLFVLPLNFGANFPGANRWLQLEVRTNIGSFTTLTPRQQLTPAPYAITASNLSGTLPAAQLSGTIGSSNLSGAYSGALTMTNPANVFVGSFTGNGAGLSNVPAGTLVGTVPAASLGNAWQIAGNGGTTAGTHFLGTTDNQPLEIKVNGTRALRLEPNTNNAPNVIAGSPWNYAETNSIGSTIAGGGGGLNYFGGPYTNIISGYFDTIGGGAQNLISGSFGTIGGGAQNVIRSTHSTIAGGNANIISSAASSSFIGGGYSNVMGFSAGYSVIGGGWNNVIENADFNVIGGGKDNGIAGTSAAYATISGGSDNNILELSLYGVIAGGRTNSIDFNAPNSAIGGGAFNRIESGSPSATIGGGTNNVIQANAVAAVIGGGAANTIQTNADYATIGGGNNNTILPNADYATISGGGFNTIQTDSDYATIGGGGNTIRSNAYGAAIGGGTANTIEANGTFATIGGGQGNTSKTDTKWSVIGGGRSHTIQTNTLYATIGGGFFNTILANANSATIPGGYLNSAAGDYSFAAGHRAKANHNSAFVWADYQNADFASTGSNQFLIHASGGVGIGKNNPATALDVNGTVTATALNVNGTVTATALNVNGTAVATTVEANSGGASSPGFTFQGDSNTGMFNPAANTLALSTGGAERLRIESGGDVGIGVTNPVVPLHIDGGSDVSPGSGGYLMVGPVGGLNVTMDNNEIMARNNGATATLSLNFSGGDVETGSRLGVGRTPAANMLEVEGNASKTTATAWLANSDARIKRDIRTVTNALEKLAQVRLVNFRYTKEYQAAHPVIADREYLNVVAQEFREVFPDAVQSSREKLPSGGDEILQVDSYPLTIYSAAAIQELNHELKQKGTEITELKQELAEIKRLLVKLSAKGN